MQFKTCKENSDKCYILKKNDCLRQIHSNMKFLKDFKLQPKSPIGPFSNIPVTSLLQDLFRATAKNIEVLEDFI